MAKWTPAPLQDGCYADSARSFVHQDALNMIRVNAEAPGTRNDRQLKTVPGLLPICAVADVSRQRGGYVCEGRLLVVMDTTLYQVATTNILTVLGTIPGTGRVSFSHNQIPNGNEVLITNGTQGFIYSTVAGTLTQITDSGFLGGLLSAFIGNRFLSVDPARRRFQNGELADGLNWNSSEFYLGESDPDRIRAIAVLNNEVVLLSEQVTEHFAYTGTTNALFENKGIAIGRGCAATHAVSVLDNALFFIGNDGSAYEKRGYELRRITSHAIEQAWAKNDASKAFSFVWEDNGHKVWYVTFPVGEEAGTWGYDVATRTWHRRESYGMHRWRLAWLAKWNGEWVGGEYNGGRIFRLDWDYPLEGSDCLSREGSFGVMHNNGNRMSLHALKLQVEAGPTVAAVEVDPQVPIPLEPGRVGPTLLLGSSEYLGEFDALTVSADDQAPSFKAAQSLSTSADGLVLCGKHSYPPDDLFIAKWDGESYVLQTIVGSTPGAGGSSVYRTAINADGTFVLVSDNTNSKIWVYKQTSATEYTKVQEYSITSGTADGIAFSPDYTQVVASAYSSYGVFLYDFNATTGALTLAVTAAEATDYSSWFDWVGDYILCSDCIGAVVIRDAATLAIIATGQSDNWGVKYQAYFNAATTFIFYKQADTNLLFIESFDGADLTADSTINIGATQPVTTVISKDRTCLLFVNTTNNKLFSISGGTLTEITDPSLTPVGSNAAVFTGLDAA